VEISETAFSGCMDFKIIIDPNNPVFVNKEINICKETMFEKTGENQWTQSKSWAEVFEGLDFDNPSTQKIDELRERSNSVKDVEGVPAYKQRELASKKPVSKEKHLIVTMGSIRPPEFSSHAEMKAKELLDLFARSNKEIRIIDVVKTTHHYGGAERFLDSVTRERGCSETKIIYTYDPSVEYTVKIIDVLRASRLFANIEEKDVD
jgi:hypothetical protein